MSILVDGVPASAPLPDVDASERLAPARDASRAAPDAPSDFERLLHGLGGAIDRGEGLVAGAASGYSGLDAGSLIALQAGIYRYSEAVDLTGKLVDRAATAVRTVLQGGH